MSRGPDATTLLRRALEHGACESGLRLAICASESNRWSSATFTGAQHRFVVTAADDAAFDRWLRALGEREFTLRGHLVADVALASIVRAEGRAVVVIEALTVEQDSEAAPR